MQTRIAILHSTIRGDEKLLIKALKDRNVDYRLIDVRKEVFNPETFEVDFDIALNRSVSTVKGMYAVMFLESMGVKCVNSYDVSRICEDKFYTSLVLSQHNVSTVDFAMVFTEDQAKEAVEDLGGYPVVLKSPLGSWGRLMAKIDTPETLEALIEHKQFLGYPQQKAYYLQAFVEKGGRDIRVNVMNGRVVTAIYRKSPHWITNTARGGRAENCEITSELEDICLRAAEAVGGGILAIDVFETEDGLTINEINHTMEFKNSEEPTGVSISGEIVDTCLEIAKQSGYFKSK